MRRDTNEWHALEFAYALARLIECDRLDLVTLLESGAITPSEAFVRLHTRTQSR